MSRVLGGACMGLLSVMVACSNPSNEPDGGDAGIGPTADAGRADSGVPDAGPSDGGVPDGGSPGSGGATHTIFGTLVSHNSSVSPNGVSVQLSGSATATATTNSSAQFSFSGLHDGTYTLDFSICQTVECDPAVLTVQLQGADVSLLEYIVGCSPDETVSGGRCVCPSGLTACASGGYSACVLTPSDDANCGGCGVRCGAGTVCSDGACVPQPVLLGSLDGGAQFASANCTGLKVANGSVFVNAVFADQNLQNYRYEIDAFPVDGGTQRIAVAAPRIERSMDVDGRDVLWAGTLDAGSWESVYLQPLDGGAPAELTQITQSFAYYEAAALDPASAYFLVVANASSEVTATITQVDRSTEQKSTLYSSPDYWANPGKPPPYGSYSLAGDPDSLYLGNPIQQSAIRIQKSDGGAAPVSSFTYVSGPLTSDGMNLYAPGDPTNNNGVYALPLDGGAAVQVVGRNPADYFSAPAFSVSDDAVYWTGYEDLYHGISGIYELTGLLRTPTDGGSSQSLLPNSPACFTVSNGAVFYVTGFGATLDVYRFDLP